MGVRVLGLSFCCFGFCFSWEAARVQARGRCCCAAAPAERVVPLQTRAPAAPAGAGAEGLRTVVLIHGLDSWSGGGCLYIANKRRAFGSMAGTWQGLMEELARRGIRTLAVDLRGWSGE